MACSSGKPAELHVAKPPAPVVALTSPGPLIAAHATAACSDCHVDGSKALAAPKCLECHRAMRARLDRRIGLHAAPMLFGKPCWQCHLDHRGATYDARGWANLGGGQQGFDHALTGWPLHGGHTSVACDRCHPNAKSFAADRACVACHRAAQPHQITRKDLACDRCHHDAAWQPPLAQMKFDHDDRKDARFPLLGAHANATCAKCHPGGVFATGIADANDCARCHATPHGSDRFGKRACARCHAANARDFKVIATDHVELGGIDLRTHRSLACVDCHTKQRGTGKARGCADCHTGAQPAGRKVSRHGQRFAKFTCDRCHPSTSWRPSAFDHTRWTKFQIHGEHDRAQCRSCHRGKGPADFEDFKGDTRCKSCHAHQTVHSDAAHPTGKYTTDQCRNCHLITTVPRPWPQDPAAVSRVHGAQGTFPLVEGHRAIPCADCHTSRDPRGRLVWTGVSTDCAPCHADAHAGKHGATCTPCHRGGKWK